MAAPQQTLRLECKCCKCAIVHDLDENAEAPSLIFGVARDCCMFCLQDGASSIPRAEGCATGMTTTKVQRGTSLLLLQYRGQAVRRQRVRFLSGSVRSISSCVSCSAVATKYREVLSSRGHEGGIYGCWHVLRLISHQVLIRFC